MVNRKKTERKFTPNTSIGQFARDLARPGEKVCFRYFDRNKELQTISYAGLAEQVRNLTAGLFATGLAGKRIAVIGETSVEWVSSFVAVVAAGGTVIPMDRELDVETIKEFFAFAEADAVIYSRSFNEKFAGLADGHKTVRVQIPMDPDEGAETDETMLPYVALVERGAGVTDFEYPVTDLNRMAEMLFTSGTTGSSKCVMLSEGNLISAVNSACATVDFSPDDVIVSVLPIHHTYELCIMLGALTYGMEVAINDSIKHVLRNFALFKPTGLVLVPLFVSTMNKKIWDEAKKKGKDKTLRRVIKLSRALRKIGIDARRKLFRSVIDPFGGRLNKIICGGAPLNPELTDVFSEFGIDIYEGYGITECSPLIAVNPYFAPKKGSVGPSVPNCTVKIESDHRNDRGFDEGEILAKGGNVMLGYYKNEEATAAAFTEDGWFRTGDIGYKDQDDYIFITGRKKFVIVLENGKNVFPEELEEYLATIPQIGECVVLGRHLSENEDTVTVTAIVYPAPDFFLAGTPREEIEKAVRDEISKLNRKLVSYKQIRNVEFRYEPFEKTTSRKIKRHLVK